MQIYSEVIVAYDVEDNRTRTKIFKCLKDYGLTPIQKSVFWGRISTAEKRAVQRLFQKSLNLETDRAFLVHAPLEKEIGRYGFGYRDTAIFNEQDYRII